MTVHPKLSCYTTNLIAYLELTEPQARLRLAAGVRLAVRDDAATGRLEFSHHPRLDVNARGHGLAYRSAPTWVATTGAIRAELARACRVLACGDTYSLPWSPYYGRAHAPHWLLLHEHADGRWLVADHFAALTPVGSQEPYLGWLDDDQLRAALLPIANLAPEQRNRDRHALGVPVALPPPDHFRWLENVPADESELAVTPHEWVSDTAAALEYVSRALHERPDLLAPHIDDLWTASRHFTYRLDVYAAAGRINAAAAHTAGDAWEQLPRALRFAADSAARGRRRAGVLTQAFDQLISALLACDRFAGESS